MWLGNNNIRGFSEQTNVTEQTLLTSPTFALEIIGDLTKNKFDIMSLAISGTDLLEVPTIFFRPIFQG